MMRKELLAVIIVMAIAASCVVVGVLGTGYTALSEKDMTSIKGSLCTWCNNYDRDEKMYFGTGSPPECDADFLYCQRDDICLGFLTYGYCECLDDGSEEVSCDKYDAVPSGEGCAVGEKICSNCTTRERSKCKNPSHDEDCAVV